MKSLNLGVLSLSIIVGTVLVLGFAYISGGYYSSALFPTLAIFAGFIITGFIIGLMSIEVTISEPGIGAIVVAILTFLLVPLFKLKGFAAVNSTDWIIVLMNAVVLTFVGAWIGEKIQHGNINEGSKANFDWSWVVTGTILGITLNIILVIFLTLILGADPTKFIIPFFLSLLVVGIIVGRYSPGVTIKEAGLAGFLIIAIEFDIARLTL